MVRRFQAHSLCGQISQSQMQQVIPVHMVRGIIMGVDERRLQERSQQSHGQTMMEHSPHEELGYHNGVTGIAFQRRREKAG